MQKKLFSHKIIAFYLQNKRNLPWRETTDPYFIWLSEIILQQTQVTQGLSYYEKFKNTFETVHKLANSSEQEVLNLWQGLGYYSRARNLHFTAKTIVNEMNGKFPNSYKELIKLKGVGHYTAAAIASFSFNEHVAVLDGNVFRVLSRVFGITEPINSTQGMKVFKALSQKLLPKENSHTYNQGIMEFGALQCVPKSPSCDTCVMNDHCNAFLTNRVNELPIKLKKIKIKPLFIHFFIIRDGSDVYLNQRIADGIWKNLWEFPNVTSGKEIDVKEALNDFLNKVNPSETALHQSSPIFTHLLSHKKIKAQFHRITLAKPNSISSEWTKIPIEQIDKVPIHRLMDKFLDSHHDFLSELG